MCWFPGSWSMWLSLFGRVGCEGSLSCRIEGWHEVPIPWLLFLDVGVVKGAQSRCRCFFLVEISWILINQGFRKDDASSLLISDHMVKVLHFASWISWWNGRWLMSHRFTETSKIPNLDICHNASSSAHVCTAFSASNNLADRLTAQVWHCRPLRWWCHISCSSVCCRWCKRSCWWQTAQLWKSWPRSVGIFDWVASYQEKLHWEPVRPFIYIYICIYIYTIYTDMYIHMNYIHP